MLQRTETRVGGDNGQQSSPVVSWWGQGHLNGSTCSRTVGVVRLSSWVQIVTPVSYRDGEELCPV